MRTPAHDTPLGRLMTERGLSQSFLPEKLVLLSPLSTESPKEVLKALGDLLCLRWRHIWKCRKTPFTLSRQPFFQRGTS